MSDPGCAIRSNAEVAELKPWTLYSLSRSGCLTHQCVVIVVKVERIDVVFRYVAGYSLCADYFD